MSEIPMALIAFSVALPTLHSHSLVHRAPVRLRPIATQRPSPPRANVSSCLQAVPAVLASSQLMLAVSSPALDFAKLLAGPGINIFNFIMIIRIILTWYPQTDLAKVPWIFIAVPTEPLLRETRKVIKPVGGVDISPIVWFAFMSFVHEILVGPQGLLILLSRTS